MQSLEVFTEAALVGAGATAIMDVWLLGLKRAGVPTGNMALIGRWVGHFRHRRFAHAAIGQARPIRGERALGWLIHYLTGIGYALLFIGFFGAAWLEQPRLLPAAAFGLATVAAPWLLMQPAMGQGLAASRTPAPNANRLRSLANHLVFGAGLFASATVIAWITR